MKVRIPRIVSNRNAIFHYVVGEKEPGALRVWEKRNPGPLHVWKKNPGGAYVYGEKTQGPYMYGRKETPDPYLNKNLKLKKLTTSGAINFVYLFIKIPKYSASILFNSFCCKWRLHLTATPSKFFVVIFR